MSRTAEVAYNETPPFAVYYIYIYIYYMSIRSYIVVSCGETLLTENGLSAGLVLCIGRPIRPTKFVQLLGRCFGDGRNDVSLLSEIFCPRARKKNRQIILGQYTYRRVRTRKQGTSATSTFAEYQTRCGRRGATMKLIACWSSFTLSSLVIRVSICLSNNPNATKPRVRRPKSFQFPICQWIKYNDQQLTSHSRLWSGSWKQKVMVVFVWLAEWGWQQN